MFGDKRAPFKVHKGYDGWWRLTYREYDLSQTVAIAPSFLDALVFFPKRAKKFLEDK